MCTVSHCHKILPGSYRYKRCEQHRLQNRYHSNLKRLREKVFKGIGQEMDGKREDGSGDNGEGSPKVQMEQQYNEGEDEEVEEGSVGDILMMVDKEIVEGQGNETEKGKGKEKDKVGFNLRQLVSFLWNQETFPAEKTQPHLCDPRLLQPPPTGSSLAELRTVSGTRPGEGGEKDTRRQSVKGNRTVEGDCQADGGTGSSTTYGFKFWRWKL
jgi:hypothetical protein